VLYSNQFTYFRIIETINDILKVQLKLADFAGLMQMAKKSHGIPNNTDSLIVQHNQTCTEVIKNGTVRMECAFGTV
jgi:hypothetical protein